jgi:hypothetical protein
MNIVVAVLAFSQFSVGKASQHDEAHVDVDREAYRNLMLT